MIKIKKLIYFELKKIFSRRLTQIALMAVLLLSLLLNFADYQSKYAYDGNGNEGSGKAAVKIDQEIASRYEGILTDEKVQQIMSDFAPKIDLHGMNAAYLNQNATQSAAFIRFSDPDGSWNGLRVQDVFGDEEIRIGYVDGWLSTSRNMAKVFAVLFLAIIIMAAPVFSGEYESVAGIILTSKYGKTKCTAAKAVASILAALSAAAVTAIVHLAAAFVLYGKAGLDCSILFSSAFYAEGFIPFNITCASLLKYQVLLAFTGALGVTGITLLLSAVCNKQIVAFVTSAAAYLFPVLLPVSETSFLFRWVALLPLYHAQAISLLSIEQLKSGMLYAVWAIPAALFFLGIGVFISRRAFARHQIS